MKIGPHNETLAGYMAPRRISGEELRRLVMRAVGRAAKDENRDAVMRIALLNAGESDVPDGPARLTAFVLGPLCEAVVEFAGDDAGHSMVQALTPLLRMKSELELPEDDAVTPPPPASEAPPGDRMVLIVDQEVAVRAQVVRVLRANGFNAVSAPDTNVALAMCVRRRPDVLVASRKLGTTDARQLAALLHVAFGDEAPPLLLLADEKELSEADRAAAAAVLPKPIEEAALLRALDTIARG
jgi:CheY-like chemotaxis protein